MYYQGKLRVSILGDSYVGKTSLMLRYCDNIFTYQLTNQMQSLQKKEKIISVGGEDKHLTINDTLGFKFSIINSAYRFIDAFIIMYDITREETFKNCMLWINEVHQLSDTHEMLVLVGNKADLKDQRTVSYSQGKQLADSLGIEFVETSALSGNNINHLFTFISSNINTDDPLRFKQRRLKYTYPNNKISQFEKLKSLIYSKQQNIIKTILIMILYLIQRFLINVYQQSLN